MAVYYLFQNVIAAQSPPPAPPPRIISPASAAPPGPEVNQAFQLVASVSASTVSCTAQVVASNDGVNWAPYGSPMVITTAVSPANITLAGNSPFQFFGAYVVSISGTNATATMTMSA